MGRSCLTEKSKPKTFALPAVKSRKQTSISTVVVLPAPFGPTKEKLLLG